MVTDDPELTKDFDIFAQTYYREGGEPPLTPAELARRTIENLPDFGCSVQALERFLTKLLGGNYPDEVLDRMWKRSWPVYSIRPGYHRPFYTEIRDIAREVIDREKGSSS